MFRMINIVQFFFSFQFHLFIVLLLSVSFFCTFAPWLVPHCFHSKHLKFIVFVLAPSAIVGSTCVCVTVLVWINRKKYEYFFINNGSSSNSRNRNEETTTSKTEKTCQTICTYRTHTASSECRQIVARTNGYARACVCMCVSHSIQRRYTDTHALSHTIAFIIDKSKRIDGPKKLSDRDSTNSLLLIFHLSFFGSFFHVFDCSRHICCKKPLCSWTNSVVEHYDFVCSAENKSMIFPF